MTDYNPNKIEKKWQELWEENGVFRAVNDTEKKKFFGLIEFPYPSGDGLHVGHPRSNTAIDIIARKRRLEGYNVLYPMGWDAFGLPTENYAIKNKIHPAEITKDNIDRFRQQLKDIGFSFDWSREINTTDPKYYKWTQWIFLKLFERGLAYKAEMAINWCSQCKCGLANEEVVNGLCERCHSKVIRRVKSQWMLKITEYASRLIDDLDLVDFPDMVKAQQINWIGRSEGAEVDFKVSGTDDLIKVYTTRPDTLFGATYMVLSPEHPYIDKWKDRITNYDDVLKYKRRATAKSDFERAELNKDKTGVELKGIVGINPVNGKGIPVWISDYVLMSYGTGAIMAVPAHDTRDYEFAKKFDLPVVEVVGGGNIEKEAYTDIRDGVMVNSGFINGMGVSEAKDAVIAKLEKDRTGCRKINYKLRDWVFSRQRYWGEPIPLVNCPTCGYVPIPEEQLPLELPQINEFAPGPDGESPLADIEEWVNTTCPVCGGLAKRETDTMPQWAGSSWYFLRYCDPDNDDMLASSAAIDYWMPVDWYNGGMEHTTLHLLYSRFWHKFLYDIGVVSTKEPYAKRTSHGMILGADGVKMSKSRGNVVNPDEIVGKFGADTFRVYEMFMGAFDQAIPWSEQGVAGSRRFLDRLWRVQMMLTEGEKYSEEMETLMHKTIAKVSVDFEKMKFNTAIAQIMTLINAFYEKGSVTMAEWRTLLILLNPVAPHITEELWQLAGFKGMLCESEWPEWEEEKAADAFVEIAIQINGKLKGVIGVSADAGKEEIRESITRNESIMNLITETNIVKEIYVPGRIYNFVIKNK